MDERDWLAARFQQHRPRLRAVAYRMLGSTSEADDAVREAWIRLSRLRPPTMTGPESTKLPEPGLEPFWSPSGAHREQTVANDVPCEPGWSIYGGIEAANGAAEPQGGTTMVCLRHRRRS